MKIGPLGLLIGAGLAWYAFNTYKKTNMVLMASQLGDRAEADLIAATQAAAELQAAADLALASLETPDDDDDQAFVPVSRFGVPMVEMAPVFSPMPLFSRFNA